MENKTKAEVDVNDQFVNELSLADMLQKCHQLYVEEKTGVFCY